MGQSESRYCALCSIELVRWSDWRADMGRILLSCCGFVICRKCNSDIQAVASDFAAAKKPEKYTDLLVSSKRLLAEHQNQIKNGLCPKCGGTRHQEGSHERYMELMLRAKSGHVEAQYRAGLYIEGTNLREYTSAGIHFWDAAAHNGHAGASLLLARINLFGLRGVPVDSEAARHYLDLCPPESAEARFELAGIAHMEVSQGIFNSSINYHSDDIRKIVENYKIGADQMYAPSVRMYAQYLLSSSDEITEMLELAEKIGSMEYLLKGAMGKRCLSKQNLGCLVIDTQKQLVKF